MAELHLQAVRRALVSPFVHHPEVFRVPRLRLRLNCKNLSTATDKAEELAITSHPRGSSQAAQEIEEKEIIMGMSTSVYGFRPPDEKWKQMKAAWDACKTAGIEVPSEVWNFFNDEPPDSAGVVIHLSYKKHPCVSEYRGDCSDGFEIDLSKLPNDITIIRFVNSC